eukprot:TRINITY_DN2511_c0_g1_i10.p1 TRINITY_DN2511_c0_g1~~TRINITY_DN2511_c0_g1_i10.p1  ORF type:complete len:125 (+),score=26.84 TRINITY_DN2511_c0_g1_i10:87-461(+)
MSTVETDGKTQEHIAGKSTHESSSNGIKDKGAKRGREDEQVKDVKESPAPEKKEKSSVDDRKKKFPWMHPGIVPKTKPGIGGGMGLYCTEFIKEGTVVWRDSEEEIGRAVQQECRDRSRMPSSA